MVIPPARPAYGVTPAASDLLVKVGPAFVNGPVDRAFQPRTTVLMVTAVILLALVGSMAAQRWTGDSHFALQGSAPTH